MSNKNNEKSGRGEHSINVFVSYEIKEKINELARKYDKTIADVVRAILKLGIPMMECLSEAEERIMREYLDCFRKLRQVKSLNDI